MSRAFLRLEARPPSPREKGPGGLVCWQPARGLAVGAGTGPLRASEPLQAMDCVRSAPALQTDELNLAVHLFGPSRRRCSEGIP